jgi:putative ABC transport system permease protein
MRFYRYILKNRVWLSINFVGLSIGIASVLIITLFVRNELSYDRFHSKADRTYRVTTESDYGTGVMHPAWLRGEWPLKMAAELHAVEKIVRLVPFRNAVIRIGDNIFYSHNAYATDSTFFDVFDFDIIIGDAQKAFTQPARVFISKSLAMKYFGQIDVLGEKVEVLHQQDSQPTTYIIDGVMNDFPENSHFKADLLTSFSQNHERSWAYTYFLLTKEADFLTLENSIQELIDERIVKDNQNMIVHLQNIRDIHLFSNKAREMGNNGSIRVVLLLGASGLMILLIVLFNYLNLSRVQFFANIKLVKIKMINGASKKNIAFEIIGYSFLLTLASILMGLMIATRFAITQDINVFSANYLWELITISIFFFILIALLSVLPFVTTRNISGIESQTITHRIFSGPIIAQFALAILTISGALILNRQMDLIIGKHPASQDSDIIVISNNQWNAIQRYESFKEKLMKEHSIVDVSGVMEEPAGDIMDGFDFKMEGINFEGEQMINVLATDSNFFRFMGIEPLAGTIDLNFTPSMQWENDAYLLSQHERSSFLNENEARELERKVVGYSEQYILNESALGLMGIVDPEEAIGRSFSLDYHLKHVFPDGRIVGVVPDFHYTNLYQSERPLVMIPRKMFLYSFLIKIQPGQHSQAVEAIHSHWEKINPEYPFHYEYISDSYKKFYSGEYTQTKVLTIFSLVVIILSSLGVFSLATFMMQKRTKEIGIRKVNGAKIWEVLVMLNKDFIKWVIIAFVIATPIAWYAMNRWLQNFAYRTELSWWIFALAGLLALGIALLTVSFQSWRAARRNPVEALRYE